MRELGGGIDEVIDNQRKISKGRLVEIGGVSTLRVTDLPFPVTLVIESVSRTFTPAAINVGQIVVNADGQQACEIGFQNDLQIRSMTFLEDFKDRPCSIWDIYFDGTDEGAIQGVVLLIRGETDGVVGNIEGTVDRAIIPIIPPRRSTQTEGPRQAYATNCRYRFKDQQCAYAGPQTECNRSWQRCLELANTHRFGGFRYAPKEGTVIRVGGSATAVLASRTFPQEYDIPPQED